MEPAEARDGDLDLLELEPLELDLELELDEDRDPEPEPLELEPESLERDFLRFFFVLWEVSAGAWSRGPVTAGCPFMDLLRSTLSLLYCSVRPPRSFQP